MPIIGHLSYLFKAGEQSPGGQTRPGPKEETNSRRGYPPPSDLGLKNIADKFSNHVHGSPCAPRAQVPTQCALAFTKEKGKRKEKRSARARAGFADE
ncbi:unnamed protein product [Tuber melanosporum]|uniref:(Perigord truffle) hypothetical protein n=1 Tax=Tuber melanosporum (strain Mel28) TaxID=656061 RepID=D5GPT4_TUBMM|nr:uncharacterized protein GSTUM_00012023001 [Tuber melanosporum]CAZ86527.1 unnamed protein product [Tuber melanosporum]